MDRLRAADPSSVGGHRLVARLGAGGMGVVYLARTPLGGWAAVKVIRAEYAADPGFRARFRREAELAARVTSRWTVPVLAADADAREPWLATAYVPGLPLSEAVAVRGPWPAHRVRTLAAALVEALDAVHTAGLVHRDVKPDNVLLAADGPRLIDFGIARAVGSTGLTETGSVIGSAGYLSPEQARGGRVGPAGDVFSLGCVLAHTATGRHPFGTGRAPVVLYRTVHEEPDLDGLSGPLAETVRACVAKDPEDRPGMGELREAFGGFTEDGWLPEGLPALVAERAHRVLDLPLPRPTRIDGETGGTGELDQISDVDETGGTTAGAGAGPRPGRDAPAVRAAVTAPTRRRLLAGGAALGVSAALGVTAAGGAGAWWTWGRTPAPTGGGRKQRRALPQRTVALLGTSADPLVTAQARGAQLAVDRHQRDPARTVDLALRTVHDGGTGAGAAAAVTALAADPRVYAVIAAGTSTTVPAAVAACTAVGLTVLVVRADTEDLNTVNTTTALMLRATETVGPLAGVRHLNRVVAAERTVVVRDLGDGGRGLPTFRMAVSHGKLTVGTIVTEEVTAGAGFGAAAGRIAEHPTAAVLFAGVTPARAAALARALRAAGHQGVCVAGEHVLAAPFLRDGEGWYVAACHLDAAADPRTRAFAVAHRARYGTPPAAWAAEAYDAVCFAVQGVTRLGAEGGRDELKGALLARPWQGITRRMAYDSAATQLYDSDGDGGHFLYRVQRGAARYMARLDDIG
ncbi:bifunctional serine/threonine-protein kinase/ABC transporter substrate-binding protein [Streptomyces gardneri]|uniref:bifunctional serine/threonine-protein kinase/ABC transporter substrate-binding protein n=1 Tax=Streptomyces gardneri TaxID=66892 RepID=UPI0036BEB33F